MTIAMNVPSGAPGRSAAAATPARVLRRIPLPATEPPFDDELGRTVGRLQAVPVHGRIRYHTALVSAAADDPVLTPPRPARPAPGRPAPLADPASVDDPAPAGPKGARTGTGPSYLRLVRPSAAGISELLGGQRPAATAGGHIRVLVDSAALRSRMLGTDDADLAGPPVTAAGATMPDPRPLATQVVQAVVEILAGDRRVSQLAMWVDEEVYAAVAAAAPPIATRGTRGPSGPAANRVRPQDRPLVRSVHLSRPTDGVAEISARVQTGARSRAVALRLEQWRGRWRCNALTVG